MTSKDNIESPAEFKEKLQDVMGSVYQLFELSKEQAPSTVNEDGVTRHSEDAEKCCFEVSGKYDRPSEFLQAFLDIIRVNFEPHALGTFFLNSNMVFLYDGIPEYPFHLGYISMTSKSNQEFSSFWDEDVIPYILQCGYSVDDTSTIYAIVSTGDKRYGVGFMESIINKLNSGFSVDEAVGLLSTYINETMGRPEKDIYSGFCLDTSLGNKIRMSIWLMGNNNDHVIQ